MFVDVFCSSHDFLKVVCVCGGGVGGVLIASLQTHKMTVNLLEVIHCDLFLSFFFIHSFGHLNTMI